MPLNDVKFRVDRAHPGFVVFLIDQSYSMNQGIAGTTSPKIDRLTTAINRFIGDLIIRCEKGEDKPRHYFDIAVIGYTTTQTDPPLLLVGSVLQSDLDPRSLGRDIVSIVELADFPLDVENRTRDDGAGGLISFKFPVWYRKPDETQMGGTPMRTALEYTKAVIESWTGVHADSMPPIVIHLTDGESNDCELEELLAPAEALRGLTTDGGNLLLFNGHLSSSLAAPTSFPAGEDELDDPYAKILFQMSSELPAEMRGVAETMGVNLRPGARGMVFNADSNAMLQLITIGTRPGDMAAADQAVPMDAAGLQEAPESPEDVPEWMRAL